MFTLLRKGFVAYIVLIVLFVIGLLVSAYIPRSAIQEHVGQSLEVFQKEGTYPSTGFPFRSIVLDNFTDALMFNTAYSVDTEKPFSSVMLNNRYQDGVDQTANLEATYKEGKAPQTSYERYWHGYLVYLRPFLTVTSFEGIRIINAVLLYTLFGYFLSVVWQKLGKKMVISLLIGFVFVDFFFIWKSLQFSSVFYIAIIGSIYLLKTFRKEKTYYLFFFIIGGFTAFFDLLTAPLITLGLPLIILLKLQQLHIRKVISLCVSWSVGYLLIWASKWIMVELFVTPGAIQTALDQISNRTVAQPDPDFSHITTIKRNLLQLIGYHKSNKIIAVISAFIAGLFFWRYGSLKNIKLDRLLPLVFITSIPYLWYLVAANHSYIHVWFTYRIQLLAVVSIMMMYAELINWQEVKASFFKVNHQKNANKR